RSIHESEEQLREVLRRYQAGESVPVRVANRSRPTRPNATEPGALRVVGGNFDQWNPRYFVENRDTAARIRRRLLQLNVPITEQERRQRTVRISLTEILNLIESIPIRPNDPGRWDSGVIRLVLESYAEQDGDRVPLYVRGLQEEPPSNGWVRGRLS